MYDYYLKRRIFHEYSDARQIQLTAFKLKIG